MPLRRGSMNDSGIWLQFTNRNSLSEEKIRSLFGKYGGVKECDGAVSGPSDGWVMISMDSIEKAHTAMKGLKDSGNSIGDTISLMNRNSMENGAITNDSVCLRCNRNDHRESECRAKEKSCSRCNQTDPTIAAGHFSPIHGVTDTKLRSQIIDLLGPKAFSDWPEANLAENVKIVTKRSSQPRDYEKFENPNSFGGSNDLLSSSDAGDMGGMKNLSAMYSKILELTSHNNNLLLVGMRETVEDCNRQLKEKDDQIRRLQNIVTNYEENIRKLTSKLHSTQELDTKAKKFFGENEDFHKKKAQELTKQNQDLSKKLAESEKSRFERVLEESDTSRVKAEVEKLTGLSDNILSKTEQVFAVVQGMDIGTVVRSDGKGD
jgi:hypothetical protein